MTNKQIIRYLVEEEGLENVFDMIGLDPVVALFELHEIGVIDLERLIESLEDDEEQDDEG